LRLYTFVPDDRIDALTSIEGAALREANRVLAVEVTALTHGREAAEQADAAARALFGAAPTAADESIPTTEIGRAEIAAGLTLAELFVRAGLCASRGDARRQAAQGGLSLDDVRIADVDAPFQPASDAVLLRRGKKTYRRAIVV
ncbi:MAG TPA: hypothetical protein VFI22_11120, partial [Thermomicrobiales bacterium]|nr:hypothetical protein [Thermomicrobiales bacterium]